MLALTPTLARPVAALLVGLSIWATSAAAQPAPPPPAAAASYDPALLFDARLREAEAKITKLEAKSSSLSLPGLLSVLVGALIGAAVSGVSTYAFARRAEAKARAKENLAASLKIVEDWIGMRDTIGEARWALVKAPLSLRDDPAQRNKVIAYGNWLELMATRWRADLADVDFLRKLEMDVAAREFWNEFEQARQTLTKAAPPFDLEPYRTSWTALQALAAT